MKLLGSQVIITGVRPVFAQTLVHLGIDLSGDLLDVAELHALETGTSVNYQKIAVEKLACASQYY